MSQTRTTTLPAGMDGIAQAADLLRAGALVALPTETVYGLGADATSDRAVAAIYAAKGRPSFNPLIAHCADLAMARALARFDAPALELARAFWPGPLTLVLPQRPQSGISRLVTAGGDQIALRVPGHPAALAVIAALGRPVAAPSANASGRISPTTVAHVLRDLDGRIAAILDAGPCDIGLESTIVGFDPVPTILRHGAIPQEALARVLGRMPALPDVASAADPVRPVAPGQLVSHYAPAARLVTGCTAPLPGALMLGFGPVGGDLNLSPGGDLVEAAANLFAHLHALDGRGATTICVAPVPDTGIGRAINDRLARAAAPRP